jgi:hypothetical protein
VYNGDFFTIPLDGEAGIEVYRAAADTVPRGR